jgi:peroxiredoxin
MLVKSDIRGGLVLVALTTFLLAACGGKPPVKLNIGDIAPTFQTVRLDGRPAHCPAAGAARPVVVRFWADWCKFCEGEMKAIEAVYQRHKGSGGQGLDIVAINAGQDRKTVDAFIRKIGVSYPALMDEQSKIARSFGVVGLPTTYFIDARGIVRAKVVGEADEATFERHALALLN